jgi:uncharacterized SAM-binding protein YcdF (DUF218 family)
VTKEKHIPAHILPSAKILWKYLQMNQPLQKSDVVIAMGSHDLRVAAYAAQLVLEGWAPLLICSGSFGRLTSSIWQESEAARFAAAAVEKGLSQKKILQEDRSTNTGENLLFSKSLCKKHGIPTRTVLLIHKPYMERRVWAAACKIWPEPQAAVSSPPISFKAYPTKAIPLGQIIHIMVGDFQRILVYPEKGFADPQPIPDEVMDAFDLLMLNGFTQHLI